jgi:hypothetical protein
MKESFLVPCARWAEKLATKYQDDLPYYERLAIRNHLLSCTACAAAYAFYQEIGMKLSCLAEVEPLSSLPSHLLQREEHVFAFQRRSELASSYSRMWRQSIMEAESTSQELQSPASTKSHLPEASLRGWKTRSIVQYILRAPERFLHASLTHLPVKVRYVSAGNNALYALQSRNGTLLWQYQKSTVFFSSPAMKNGILYPNALDSQIFLFAASMRLRPCSDSFIWKR